MLCANGELRKLLHVAGFDLQAAMQKAGYKIAVSNQPVVAAVKALHWPQCWASGAPIFKLLSPLELTNGSMQAGRRTVTVCKCWLDWVCGFAGWRCGSGGHGAQPNPWQGPRLLFLSRALCRYTFDVMLADGRQGL